MAAILILILMTSRLRGHPMAPLRPTFIRSTDTIEPPDCQCQQQDLLSLLCSSS